MSCPPERAPEPLAVLLHRLVTTVRAQMHTAVTPFELSVPQYVCMSTLALRPRQSSAELARTLGVSPQATNVVIQRLQRNGLVVRPGTGRGRGRPVALTPLGFATLDRVDAELRSVEDRPVGAQGIRLQALLKALPALGEQSGSLH